MDYMVLLLGVHDNGSVAKMSILGPPPAPPSSEVPRRADRSRPDNFAGEARRAGRNAGETPECAGAKISDIGPVRKEISFHGPAYMLAAVVPGSVTTGQDA